MLAIAKHDTVDQLLSKALADNQITDSEFQLIMTEFSLYNVLKEAVRAKLTWQLSRTDVEKIKQEVCSVIEADFRKNNCSPSQQHERSCKVKHIVILTHDAVQGMSDLLCLGGCDGYLLP